MRFLLAIPLALALLGCSHADQSAETPRPRATFVTTADTEADAMAQAERFCKFYSSAPAAFVKRTDSVSRFECTGSGRGGKSLFVEQLLGI
jgi:hypothetical protein